MKKLEFDDIDIQSLPPHMASAIRTLLSEIELNGEETTADETVAVIEVLVSFLGRLWLSLYIHHGAPDAEVNQFLFQSLRRDPGVGQWAGISRVIQKLMADGDIEIDCECLTGLDYGFEGSIAQLIAFRNNFSHGSMESVSSELREMRQALASLVRALDSLFSGSLLWVDENHVVRLANESWDIGAGHDIEGSELIPYHIYIRTFHGDLVTTHPLFVVRFSGENYELDASSTHVADLNYEQIFQLDCLATWYQRYQQERAGHLDFTVHASSFRANRRHLVWGSVLSRLDEINPPCRILLNEPAGLSGQFVFKNLLVGEESVIRRRFDARALYIVERDHVSQSGLTFCCFLMRQIEELSLGACQFDEIPTDCVRELKAGIDYLRDNGKQMLLGICHLHHGDVSYRGETLTVLDIYNLLSGSPITVVASALRGSIKALLSYDHFLSMEPRKRSFSLDHYTDSLALIHQNYGEFPIKVLACISSLRRPRTLFEICDLLEGEWKHEVFEPEVEKALWRLAPFLDESRDSTTREKKWVPTFHIKQVHWDQLIGEITHA
jgi:hypothetical protein